MCTDEASTSGDFPEQTSMSETVLHQGTTLPSSADNSGDEEAITTQTDSNPILKFHKDDQGNKVNLLLAAVK